MHQCRDALHNGTSSKVVCIANYRATSSADGGPASSSNGGPISSANGGSTFSSEEVWSAYSSPPFAMEHSGAR